MQVFDQGHLKVPGQVPILTLNGGIKKSNRAVFSGSQD